MYTVLAMVKAIDERIHLPRGVCTNVTGWLTAYATSAKFLRPLRRKQPHMAKVDLWACPLSGQTITIHATEVANNSYLARAQRMALCATERRSHA